MANDLKLHECTSLPIKPHHKPVVVIVLDGVGENKIKDQYNAVFAAEQQGLTPTLKNLKTAPNRFRTILAHGKAVGLPSDSDMGNSEVGHNALGAGRIVQQGASLVDDALKSGSMFAGAEWHYLMDPIIKTGRTLHMIGLLSDGGVHSRFDQMEAMIRGAADAGVKHIRMHPLTDGRDVTDGSSVQFMAKLEEVLKQVSAKGCDGKVASCGGRMLITMDRYEADWGMVEKGWKTHVLGDARQFASAGEALETLRKENPKVSDQFLPQFVVAENGQPVGKITDGDSVLFFNFRGDRAIEISKAFTYETFDKFDRKFVPKVQYAGLMQYDGDAKIPEHFLVAPPVIEKTAGIYLAHTGVRTFAVSETQKYGHVTYFWNGNRSGYIDENLEKYVETPSDNVAFNTKPEMKVADITRLTVDAIKSGKYDMIRLNFANGDMVGHTGDLPATIKAMGVVDNGLGQVIAAVNEVGGIYCVLADHGNADEMIQRNKDNSPLKDANGNIVPLTSHTLAPVPLLIGGPALPANIGLKTLEEMPKAGLANVTATYINLLGYEAPEQYEKSVLKVL